MAEPHVGIQRPPALSAAMLQPAQVNGDEAGIRFVRGGLRTRSG
jgi:hypothetical protein